MPIKYSIGKFSEDLDDFKISLESVDMESVKERTLKRVAIRMSKMVRQAVFESSIKSPATEISPYESGDGPALATNDAWIVRGSGDSWTVQPHPEVRQRAIVLNYGYPGTIDAGGDVMGFEVNGVPVFTREVEGPERTGYWQKAIRRMESSDKLREIAGEELEKEFEENFA